MVLVMKIEIDSVLNTAYFKTKLKNWNYSNFASQQNLNISNVFIRLQHLKNMMLLKGQAIDIEIYHTICNILW